MKTFVRPKGHKCCFSTAITEDLSVGTGKLDANGFWENGCYDCARAHEDQFPEHGLVWPYSKETLEFWEIEKKMRWDDQFSSG